MYNGTFGPPHIPFFRSAVVLLFRPAFIRVDLARIPIVPRTSQPISKRIISPQLVIPYIM